MRAARALLIRLVGVFVGRRRAEADLQAELESHLEMHVAENIRRGMTPEAARREALVLSGGMEIAREAVRERRGIPWLEATIADTRYAYRSLVNRPAFTAIAVATLAIGIGASTAMFSVVDGVLLKPLPYPQSDRLVALNTVSDGELAPVSPADLIDWRARTGAFTGVAGGVSSETILTGSGDPTWLSQARVTANAFEVLAVDPILGRSFVAGEDAVAAPRVALLSERLWRSRFGADSSVVGRAILLDGHPTTVVGVAPSAMRWPVAADVWLTTRFSEADLSQQLRGSRWVDAVARLSPTASLEAARTEMDQIAEQVARSDPASSEGVGIRVTPLLESLVYEVRWTLLLLFGAVGLVLLTACANVAGLTIGRVAARDAELAVRRALGAGNARVARQILTESLVLAAAGGAVGLVLASAGTKVLLALAPASLPRLDSVGLDGSVLVFAGALTCLTGVLFGLAPALQRPSEDLHQRLRPVGRGSLGRSMSTRSRRALVVAQVGLAVVLIAGAGLLIRSFALISRVDPGFRSENVATFGVAVPPRGRYDDREFTADLLAGIRRMPGVTSAAVTIALPLAGGGFPSVFEVSGRTTDTEMRAEIRTASPEYFAAMGIPLLRGRTFDERDRDGTGQKVVISSELARLYFPNEDPVGETLHAGWQMAGRRFGGEVIGVVGDVRHYGLNRAVSPHIYMPFQQWPLNEYQVVVRSENDASLVLADVRGVLRQLDPDTPMSDPRAMEDLVDASLGSRRFHLTLLGAFAAVALALAAIGVYGVIAYSVEQRRNEIGLRIALGASRERVLAMVLAEGMSLVGAGVLMGLAVALFLTRFLEGLLFEIGARDPLTLLAAPGFFVLVGLGACLFPALRAAVVDPAETIRVE